MRIGFSKNFGKFEGLPQPLQFQCPLALAKNDEAAFPIFAYAPTTHYEHEHNLTPCPVRA